MTLNRKLQWIYAATCVIPLLVAVGVHTLMFYQSARDAAQGRLHEIASHAATRLDHFLVDATRAFKNVAGVKALHGMRTDETSQYLARMTYDYPYFRDLVWVRADGSIAATTQRANLGKQVASTYGRAREAFATTANGPGGILHVVDAEPAANGAELDVLLLTRVDDARGRFVGVLVGVVDGAPARIVLEDVKRLVPGAIPVTLTTGAGALLATSESIRTSATISGANAPQSTERLLHGRVRLPGIGSERACDWRIVIAAPESLMTADVWDTLRGSVGGMLGVILVLVAVMMWLTRTVIRPLEVLAGAAKHVAEGDLSTRVAVKGDDEIGLLSHAFNQMVAKLESGLATLNIEIAERTRANRELEVRGRFAAQLAEMAGLLQAALHLDDAAAILRRMLTRMLAPHNGAMYLVKSSLNFLDQLTCFGQPQCAEMLEPSACWALRRGQTYGAAGADRDMYCAHLLPQAAPVGYVCIPMQAQGGPVGLLHIEFSEALTEPERATLLLHAAQISELAAMALANLKLRETLREQSILDPLTALHNRRYLEEVFARELARAEREHYGMAVMMIDVDHFKRFNDVHGHEAGDAVLRELGRALKQSVRGSDLACRFGGEEFTVVLIKTDLAAARDWHARLREQLQQTRMHHHGTALPTITISVGVAFYDAHGNDTETLLQAADLALYQAKRAGRDQLIVHREQAPTGAASRDAP